MHCDNLRSIFRRSSPQPPSGRPAGARGGVSNAQEQGAGGAGHGSPGRAGRGFGARRTGQRHRHAERPERHSRRRCASARAAGLPFDGTQVLNSTEAMLLQEVPGSLAIIGAGAVGVEFAYLYNTFGSHVTLIEMLPQVLPVEDHESAPRCTNHSPNRGSTSSSKAGWTAWSRLAAACNYKSTHRRAYRPFRPIRCWSPSGVQGNVETLGLDTAGVRRSAALWPCVDAHCRTGVPGIYAIGDLNGQPCLAHVASAEGIAAVETIAGLDHPGVNYNNIPGCTYCHPQVASVGLTEHRRPRSRPQPPRRALSLLSQWQGPGGRR